MQQQNNPGPQKNLSDNGVQSGQSTNSSESGPSPGKEQGTFSSITLDEELRILCRKFMCAKGAESQAKATRIAAESAIAILVPGRKDGQKTKTLQDGTKIIVKRRLIYEADLPAIDMVIASVSKRIGQQVPVPIKSKTTRALDVKGYEWFRENASDMFDLLAKHVTVKPSKDAVTIKIPKAGEISND